MQRFALSDLKAWRNQPDRKPLVIRGARQVGKSYLVQQFGGLAFDSCLCVDFERDPELAALFQSRRPAEILQSLELYYNQPVIPGKTLLFLDEIQAAAGALPSLRYFYEEMPELHVIAAGSLLDFTLAKHKFSMPVGRIEFLHLGPMQFEEFLLASGKKKLQEFLCSFQLDDTLDSSTHDLLMREFRRFMVVGGMPKAVAAYVRKESLHDCDRQKHALLTTFEHDFGKYGAKIGHSLLRKLYRRIPKMIGDKFKYVNVDRNERSNKVADALQLLNYSGICHSVRHSSCDGVPLGASASDRHFKVLFLDVGLAVTACGLSLAEFMSAEDFTVGHIGRLCEQFVGQHLLYSKPSYQEPELHYWIREKRNSSAEVDYVISVGSELVPVEVKAGKTGTLKSLLLFLSEKKRPLGVRINADVPSVTSSTGTLSSGVETRFRLLSLPFYLVAQLPRMCSAEL